MIYEGEIDGRASFKDAESASHTTELSHLSGSLGVTVGCPFLSVSVSGTYDKTVLENEDVSHYTHLPMLILPADGS